MRVVGVGVRAIASAAVIGGVLGAAPACPEETPPARPSMEIERVTVTAEKRETDIQSTPISMQAFPGETLDAKGVRTVQDLEQYTPNVHVHPNAGGNTGMTVNMRGAITSDPIITLEPAAGIYLDGVYVAKSVGSLFDMADLERVEVLRGPQGTLFGRNTVGGAISLVTKRPTGAPSVSTTFDAGNFEYFGTSSSVNAPIIGENAIGGTDRYGQLNGRATVLYRTRDSFYSNTGTGGDGFADLNRVSTEGALRYEVRDDLTFDYNFDYHRVREQNTAFQLSGVRPTGPTAFLAPFVTNDRAHAIANNATLLPDGRTIPLGNDVEVRGHGVTGTYEAGELGPFGRVTIRSITGYRSLSQVEAQDFDGSPLAVASTALRAEHQAVSEEIQWIGSAADDHIQYLAGFFYYSEKGGEYNPQVYFGATPFQTSQISRNGFSNSSLAPFGQATWTPPILGDRLSLTAGLRYTYERKESDRDFRCILGRGQPCGPLSVVASGGERFGAVTPMGSVAFQFTDDLMAYGKISRGFKSGGFNGRAVTRATFVDPYEPEMLTAYELGVKSQWLDRRLQMNVAGFYGDYEDMQVTVFRADPIYGAVTTLENAATAKIWGTEVEFLANIVEGLQFRAGYGFLGPEYEEFCERRDPVTGRCTLDVADERDFILSPAHTVTTGLSYTAPPMRCGILSAALDAYWQDDVVFAAKDNDLDAQGAYGLLNGRIQLTEIPLPEGSLAFAVWGRNLLDEKYRTFGIDFGALGFAGNSYGNPRTVGLSLTYRWPPT